MIRKVDAFCHFAPVRAMQEFERISGHQHAFRPFYAGKKLLTDAGTRLEFMDKQEIDLSIFVPLPWLESEPALLEDPRKATSVAVVMNNEMAEVAMNSNRCFRSVAILPTTNSDIMTAELTRAVKELGLVGGLIMVGPTVKRVDHSDYIPLFRLAEELDVPLWWHPSRPITCPDYKGLEESQHLLWQTLGWLKDTSDAMTHFVFSNGFVRHPKLKIITHHHGALIPLFAKRIQQGFYIAESNGETKLSKTLSQPYIDHFKSFYCDTATSGVEPMVLDIAATFFGPEHMVFGSDTPMDTEEGMFVRTIVRSIEQMTVSAESKQKIFSGNILRLLKLSDHAQEGKVS
jgi:predicted TIM-barrel fold metal-dependent hydrolase